MPIGERHSTYNKLLEERYEPLEQEINHPSFLLICHVDPWFEKFDVIILQFVSSKNVKPW
jgi:hypothetical protein